MEKIDNEYYVSLEIAKLLEKAGFNLKCRGIYVLDSENDPEYVFSDSNFTNTSKEIEGYIRFSAPTLEIAQRWLREVKGMCLTIQPLFDKVNGQFNVVIGFTPFIHQMDGEMIILSLDSEHTYEEAQEAGINKALEIILEKDNM